MLNLFVITVTLNLRDACIIYSVTMRATIFQQRLFPAILKTNSVWIIMSFLAYCKRVQNVVTFVIVKITQHCITVIRLRFMIKSSLRNIEEFDCLDVRF